MVRTKIGKFYVERDVQGRIKKWVAIRRSLSRDRIKKAKRIVRSGYGNKGDQKKYN